MEDRLRVQPPRIVKSKLDNLPPDAPREERAMLRWMLTLGKYPNWRYEVRKAVDAEVNVKGDATVLAHSAKIHGGKTETETGIGLDLSDILSYENPENSHEYLSSLEKPNGYKPQPTVADLKESFTANSYFLSDEDIFTIQQAISLGRSLLISGPPGVGKTEAAKQIALAMGLDVSDPHQYNKLFCTPDIGTEEAIYQWNDPKRLLDLQLLNGAIGSFGGRASNDQIVDLYKEISANAYGFRYLEIRKLLKACIIPYRTVVLVDEADKPYPTFDNELLDIIQFFRYEIPEYGPIGRPLDTPIDHPDNPFFVLTVNDSASGGRDLSPMLVSRCTPLFLNYLPPVLEAKVVQAKCGMSEENSSTVAQFFYTIRTTLKLRQPPSTREVIATAEAMEKSETVPTVRDMLRFNCHWLKNRLDYEAIRKKFLSSNNEWSERLS